MAGAPSKLIEAESYLAGLHVETAAKAASLICEYDLLRPLAVVADGIQSSRFNLVVAYLVDVCSPAELRALVRLSLAARDAVE